MKPPPKAVLLKQEICIETPRMDDWGFLLSEGIPLLLHVSTGLIYGICNDASESPDSHGIYAVPVGQELDEHGNYRKIGHQTAERIGREAIMTYLYAMAMFLRDAQRRIMSADAVCSKKVAGNE